MHVDAEMAQVLAQCLTASDTAVVVTDAADDMPIVYVNAAFEVLTGYRADVVLGRNCRLLQGVDTDPAAVRAIGERLRSGEFAKERLINYRADGTPFWCEVRISAVRDTTGTVVRFIGVQHDVTDEVVLLQDATRAAASDPLTGLMNRTAFAGQAELELLRAARHGRAACMLFLDVNQFKMVNDTHGHDVGDAYLQHVARTLDHQLRHGDLAARHGGDEFTVLLTDLPAGAAAATAVDIAVTHLRAALSNAFEHDGVRHRAAVTVGRALFPRDGSTVRELITHADSDMYDVKRSAEPVDRGDDHDGPGRRRAAVQTPSEDRN